MNTKDFRPLIPFGSFVLGYLFVSYLASPGFVNVPSLVGKSLADTIQLLSDHQLNTRIIMQKEDPDLAEGTILSQQPQAAQKVRPHTSIFVVISRKPNTITAPAVVGKQEKELDNLLLHHKIRAQKYYLTSNEPAYTCIGQFPCAGQELPDRKIIIYIANKQEQLECMPHVCGMRSSAALSLFQEHQLPVTISHGTKQPPHHVCQNCIVIDQKPIAGSIINTTQHNNITLHVTPN